MPRNRKKKAPRVMGAQVARTFRPWSGRKVLLEAVLNAKPAELYMAMFQTPYVPGCTKDTDIPKYMKAAQKAMTQLLLYVRNDYVERSQIDESQNMSFAGHVLKACSDKGVDFEAGVQKAWSDCIAKGMIPAWSESDEEERMVAYAAAEKRRVEVKARHEERVLAQREEKRGEPHVAKNRKVDPEAVWNYRQFEENKPQLLAHALGVFCQVKGCRRCHPVRV